MPYKLIRNKDGSFRVVNSDTGKVHSSSTTEEKAKAQMRLLYAKESGGDDLEWNTPKDKANRILKQRNV